MIMFDNMNVVDPLTMNQVLEQQHDSKNSDSNINYIVNQIIQKVAKEVAQSDDEECSEATVEVQITPSLPESIHLSTKTEIVRLSSSDDIKSCSHPIQDSSSDEISKLRFMNEDLLKLNNKYTEDFEKLKKINEELVCDVKNPRSDLEKKIEKIKAIRESQSKNETTFVQLKEDYNKLVDEHEAVLKENEKLKFEIEELKKAQDMAIVSVTAPEVCIPAKPENLLQIVVVTSAPKPNPKTRLDRESIHC